MVILNSMSAPAGGMVSELSLVHQFFLRPFQGSPAPAAVLMQRLGFV
jgi:hypothetical protein